MFRGRTFREERVILDGGSFVDCRFEGATLLFFGGKVPEIRNCSFEHVRFELEGPAKNTIDLLRRLREHEVKLD